MHMHVIRNFITTLEAAIDVGPLDAGEYQLTLRREGGERTMGVRADALVNASDFRPPQDLGARALSLISERP